MNCLRIGPPAGDRSSPRITGLPTRIIAAGGCAGSTAVAPCSVTMPAYARKPAPEQARAARDEPVAAAHYRLAAYPGRKVVAGLRPECLSAAADHRLWRPATAAGEEDRPMCPPISTGTGQHAAGCEGLRLCGSM